MCFWLATPLMAQWVNYAMPGIPRTKDGKPDLSAAAPRTREGKPDFSGIWIVASGKYLENLGADGAQISMTPWAKALFDERQANLAKDRPSGKCLGHSLTEFDAHFQPKKIIQTPGEIVLLFEVFHSFRQIFTDGRTWPEQREPSWFGYSVGKWDGDTFVVNTTGLSEQTWLDDSGHPHSDGMQIVERFRRRDFGHLEVQLTIDDPKAYTKPWTVTIPWVYFPDTELLDWVCENNKDPGLMVGK